MIHEEICTYEVSKLAKEKGFPTENEKQQRRNMNNQELKELMVKSAQAHTELLKHCHEELKRSVGINVVLRLHDGTTYSPGYACPICGGKMVIEKIQMQERYMMSFCHRCGTTIKTPFTNIEVHTPF